jgi:DNA polymerase-3 subunit delta'
MTEAPSARQARGSARFVPRSAPCYPGQVLLSDIRGQNPAIAALTRALASDRLAHAYLFDGPGGVGKQRAALGLGLSTLCPERPGHGCGKCSVCLRVLAGNHPDVRVFTPRDEGARNLQVETLRNDVLPVAQYAPFEGKATFLVFPDADISFPEQHPEAANALLKTLEEPRSRVHFVLLSARPERLLVTIRSRCQRVRFGRLPPLVLEHVLESAGVPQAEWETAIALADGRADRALAMAEDGRGKALLERALHIDATLERGSPGRLISLSEELCKADDLALIVEMLSIFYRDVAASALGVEPRGLLLSSERERVDAQAQKLGAGRASARVRELGQLGELFAKNANPQITLDNLLLTLRRVS